MVFKVVRESMGINHLSEDSPQGFEVSLHSAVLWAARELRLHNPDASELELNLKLDGRPFFGKVKPIVSVNTYIQDIQ